MKIFEILSFNLKNIRFKDTQKFIDEFLSKHGLSYTDMAFIFNGGNYDLFHKKYPSFEKYLKPSTKPYFGYGGFSSIPADFKPGDSIHIAAEDKAALCEIISKIPRPYNFSSANVILDNINWYTDFESEPFWGISTGILKIDPNHHFFGYHSNSIRMIKEYDYGNKTNLVEVCLERKCDGDELVPRPKIIDTLIEHFGKPKYDSVFCVFSQEENEHLYDSKKQISEMMKNDDFKSKFKRFEIKESYSDAFGRDEYIEARLTPIKDISFKKVLTDLGKGRGYTYDGCHGGGYIMNKKHSNGQNFCIELVVRPFESVAAGAVYAYGYNFYMYLESLPSFIVKDEQTVIDYVSCVFDVADYIEDKYGDVLNEHFGAEPKWYEKRRSNG